MDVSVESLLKLIDEPNRAPSQALWADLTQHIPDAPGSSGAHQAWPGGYADHVQEVLNIAVILHRKLGLVRPLKFSLSSSLLVLFLHDCEKPFKSASDDQIKNFDWVTKRPGKSDKVFQQLLIKHYGFTLTDEEQNALRYVEGEGAEYVHGQRVMNELAAFCHCCDVLSARLWHDYPARG